MTWKRTGALLAVGMVLLTYVGRASAFELPPLSLIDESDEDNPLYKNCGNGIVDATEQCDDGNRKNNDG